MKTALLALAIAAGTTAIALPATSGMPGPPTEPVVLPITAPVCDDLSVSIYFAAHEDMLSDFSRRSISALGDQLKGCTVTQIRASVTSEEAHTDEALADLSETRILSVLSALETVGISSASVTTDYKMPMFGGSAPTLNEPMARRVDVQVRAAPQLGT